MTKKVIDVSTYQGNIDWEKAKKQIDGAILRCGYGDDIKSQDDNKFERNASECERLGIPYGVYLYSYATNETMAKSEAAHILRLVKGRKLSYPVYLDCEEASTSHYAKTACEIIGKIITDAGYTFGVYANTSWWNNYLVGMDKYTKWVAQYYKECQYKKPYDMWQYASDGKIDGISGNVDMNYCYKDFGAKSITPLNNTSTTSTKKSIDVLVQEILDGKWGNGADRKKKLQAAGYNYEEVQAKVNEKLSGKSSASTVYVVQKGDTLSDIAKKYNTTVSKLVSTNGITNPNLIYPGQKITIS